MPGGKSIDGCGARGGMASTSSAVGGTCWAGAAGAWCEACGVDGGVAASVVACVAGCGVCAVGAGVPIGGSFATGGPDGADGPTTDGAHCMRSSRKTYAAPATLTIAISAPRIAAQ